jgi:hypothetical protein
VQLVDEISHGHELWHWPKGLAAEIGVGAGDDHADAALRQRPDQGDDPRVEKLRLVHRDDICVVAETL